MPLPRRYPNPAARQAAYRRRQAEARKAELAAKGIPSLPAISTVPARRRWRAQSEQVRQTLASIEKEAQDYYDERSDPWKESERGEAHLEYLEAVQAILSAIEELPE